MLGTCIKDLVSALKILLLSLIAWEIPGVLGIVCQKKEKKERREGGKGEKEAHTQRDIDFIFTVVCTNFICTVACKKPGHISFSLPIPHHPWPRRTAAWELVSPLFNPAAAACLGCHQLLPGSQSFLLITRKCPCLGTVIRASPCFFICGSSVALQCIIVFWCCVQGLPHCHAVCRIFFTFMLYAGFMLYTGSSLLSCCMQGLPYCHAACRDLHCHAVCGGLHCYAV